MTVKMTTLSPTQPGYYWVRFSDGEEFTVGLYTPTNNDGTVSSYPWEIVGSDDIFVTRDFGWFSEDPITAPR